MKIILRRAVEGVSVPELGQPFSTSFNSITIPLVRPSTGSVALTRYELERSLTGTSGWAQIASGPLIFGNPPTQYQDGGLIASTTYYYRARAVAGSFTTAYCAVVSTTTAASLPTIWAPSTPTVKPYVYWGAGRGSESVGGSGRDAVSGGIAAAQRVYCVNNLTELRNAIAVTGTRRRVYLCTSGLWDGGADNGLEVQNDNLTVIDLSPGQGAVLKGLVVMPNGIRNLVWMNTNLFSLNASIPFSTSHNAWADFSSGNTERDHWIAYNAMAYATDQTLSYFYPALNIGLFANIFMRPTHFNSLHDDNGDGIPDGNHGTGVFFGWRNDCQQVSSLRDIFVDCAFRSPLSGAAQLHLADGLVSNYVLAAAQLAQHNVPPTGFPSLTTIENELYIRGPQHQGSLPIEAGSPGSLLHTGSRVAVIGCRGLGITDTTQAALVQQYASPPVTIEAIRIPGTVGNGYAGNPITNNTAAKIARAQLLCDTSGPRPLQRLSYTQSVLNTIMSNANNPGSSGGLLTRGNEVFPANPPATSNLLTGPDPIPGVSSMTPTGIDVTAAARTLITGGVYDGYSQLDAWEQRQLITMGIRP